METEIVHAYVPLSDKENAKPLTELKSIELMFRGRYGSRVDKCRIHPLTIARVLETKEAKCFMAVMAGLAKVDADPLVVIPYYLGFRFEIDECADPRPTMMPPADLAHSVPSVIYNCDGLQPPRV